MFTSLLVTAGLLGGCFANPTPHPTVDAANSTDILTGLGDVAASDTAGADAAPPSPDAAADVWDAASVDAAADSAADVAEDIAADGVTDVSDGQQIDGEQTDGEQTDGEQTDGEQTDGEQTDGGPAETLGGESNCGASLTCDGAQACVSTTPGACGGAAPGPQGCEPGCNETDCGNGTPICLCDQMACAELPTGCSDCTCLSSAYDECDCQLEAGVVQLTCYAP